MNRQIGVRLRTLDIVRKLSGKGLMFRWFSGRTEVKFGQEEVMVKMAVLA